MSIYKMLLLSMVNFTFVVVEFCDPKVLLQREQHYPKEIFFFFSLTDPGVPLIKKRSTGPRGPDLLNLRLSKLFLSGGSRGFAITLTQLHILVLVPLILLKHELRLVKLTLELTILCMVNPPHFFSSLQINL
jgi:hypothetical protein